MVAIFLIATAVVFLGMDYLVQRNRKRKTASVPSLQKTHERFVVPRGYFFNSGHAWAELLPSGSVRVGIDDFLQKITGSIDAIQILRQSAMVARGEPAVVLKQGNRRLLVAAPVSGNIVAINEQVLRNPSILRNDPYAAGWIIMMEPTELDRDLRTMTIGTATATWLRKEVSRFRDFISHAVAQPQFAHAGVTMADGGLPLGGALQHANDSSWQEFEQQFLAADSSDSSNQL